MVKVWCTLWWAIECNQLNCTDHVIMWNPEAQVVDVAVDITVMSLMDVWDLIYFGLGDLAFYCCVTAGFSLGTKLWYNFTLPATETCHPQYSTFANVQVILTCDASHVSVDVGPAGSTPCSPLHIRSVCSHILFHWQNRWSDVCHHAQHFQLVPCYFNVSWSTCIFIYSNK
jgi:hypothetical protein